MCDFRLPYFKDGTKVPYDCNVDELTPDRQMKKGFSYSVGHTGSYTVYYDGVKLYTADHYCSEIEWKHFDHWTGKIIEKEDL